MALEEDRHLILRQLDDILSQSERIIGGIKDIETLENFSKYSQEFKSCLEDSTTNTMVLERVALIPDINVSQYYSTSFLSVIGSYLGMGVTNYISEKRIIMKAIEDMTTARNYYSSIQFLL